MVGGRAERRARLQDVGDNCRDYYLEGVDELPDDVHPHLSYGAWGRMFEALRFGQARIGEPPCFGGIREGY